MDWGTVLLGVARRKMRHRFGIMAGWRGGRDTGGCCLLARRMRKGGHEMSPAELQGNELKRVGGVGLSSSAVQSYLVQA